MKATRARLVRVGEPDKQMSLTVLSGLLGLVGMLKHFFFFFFFSWSSLFYFNNESVMLAFTVAPPSLCSSCFYASVFPDKRPFIVFETVLTLIPLTAMATHSLVTSAFTSLTVSHLYIKGQCFTTPCLSSTMAEARHVPAYRLSREPFFVPVQTCRRF